MCSFSNTKLRSIPTLANDLKTIFQLKFQAREGRSSLEEETGGRSIEHSPPTTCRPEFSQDLNCLPNSADVGECQVNQCNKCKIGTFHHILTRTICNKLKTSYKLIGSFSGNVARKRRAASQDVAKLSLKDLAKYFDLPIMEASRNLKVGLTVLKKKCREFGIPRWPHRKIKSLDSLIHELQVILSTFSTVSIELYFYITTMLIHSHTFFVIMKDVGQQLKDDEAVQAVVTKRQKMLEEERETIERAPFVEIQKDTKKFRQDIFKRRHRARALQSKGTSSLPIQFL